MQERIAVIDLGSNTTRMIVVGYVPHQTYKLLDEIREAVRLAHGIGSDGNLQLVPMNRAIKTMRLFHQMCRGIGVDRIVPVATSAVREATNREEFLQRVKDEAGLEFRVLSAHEEAYYGFLGAINTLDVHDGCVVDIGGGSTQVSQAYRRQMGQTISRPIGAVRLTDRFVKSDPISSRDYRELQKAISAQFDNVPWLDGIGGTLAGIGGTIRALAEIDQKMRNHPIDRVHGHILKAERVFELIETFRSLTLKQRESLPGLSRDRADLILAGASILAEVMRRGQFAQIMISGQGLREGVFFEHFTHGRSPLIPDIRSFSVYNLARMYHYEAIHSAKVRDLALSMFDQMHPMHGYGADVRELLGHAAILHDIGNAVNYYDHHKHGAYLILNSTMQGFSHREVAILALLVRYHRKGDVSTESLKQVLSPGDDELVAKMSAILRLAEFLERRKSQVVQDVTVELGPIVKIITIAAGDNALEVWDANRAAGLFRKAFGCDVDIS
ncbi:MAG: Ppx/GppA family phosphatase [Chloroflexota bacterium]|jgi:exopolyphosphatase/guanosine-5'-triphosphate,3'-diphosphate pyrophosphatase